MTVGAERCVGVQVKLASEQAIHGQAVAKLEQYKALSDLRKCRKAAFESLFKERR